MACGALDLYPVLYFQCVRALPCLPPHHHLQVRELVWDSMTTHAAELRSLTTDAVVHNYPLQVRGLMMGGEE